MMCDTCRAAVTAIRNRNDAETAGACEQFTPCSWECRDAQIREGLAFDTQAAACAAGYTRGLVVYQ